MPFNKVVVAAFEYWRGKYPHLSEKAYLASVGRAERAEVENPAQLVGTS